MLVFVIIEIAEGHGMKKFWIGLIILASVSIAMLLGAYITFGIIQYRSDQVLNWESLVGGTMAFIGTIVLGAITLYITIKSNKNNSDFQKKNQDNFEKRLISENVAILVPSENHNVEYVEGQILYNIPLHAEQVLIDSSFDANENKRLIAGGKEVSSNPFLKLNLFFDVLKDNYPVAVYVNHALIFNEKERDEEQVIIDAKNPRENKTSNIAILGKQIQIEMTIILNKTQAQKLVEKANKNNSVNIMIHATVITANGVATDLGINLVVANKTISKVTINGKSETGISFVKKGAYLTVLKSFIAENFKFIDVFEAQNKFHKDLRSELESLKTKRKRNK